MDVKHPWFEIKSSSDRPNSFSGNNLLPNKDFTNIQKYYGYPLWMFIIRCRIKRIVSIISHGRAIIIKAKSESLFESF